MMSLYAIFLENLQSRNNFTELASTARPRDTQFLVPEKNRAGQNRTF